MRIRAWKLLSGLVLLGCGSDPVSAPTSKDTQPAKCDTPPGYVDVSYPAIDVGEVVVTVHTDEGEPANHALVEVCGINACTNPAYTDESGGADVAVQTPTQKPALKYGDAFEFGELALLFEVAGKRTNFGTLYTTKLPDTGDPIKPGKRAESNGVALTLAENGTFDLPGFAPYDTEDGRGLRAAELPQDRWPDGLDHGAGLELVFTLAPMGAMLCPSPAIELPNSGGWAPGTAVEFFQQGLDAGADEGAQLFAPYGEWTSFGTGTVDDTGERLVQTEGGLPMISNVGVRRL